MSLAATMPTVLGGLLVAVAGATMVLAWGRRRWQRGTDALRERILAAAAEAGGGAAAPGRVALAGLAGLPAPVARYLGLALQEGAPTVRVARLQHDGEFDPSETRPRWCRFSSDQLVVTSRPGFDWDGRVRVAPGLEVRVHDAYVAGEGWLVARVAGLVKVAELRGGDQVAGSGGGDQVAGSGGGDQVAEGELMRFLAEAAWYPTRLLPGPDLQWQAVDDHQARATLRDGDVAVTLTFGFGDDGMIQTVRAETRPRLIDGRMVPTPWQGRFWDYAEREGMRVPLQGEVAWLTDAGPRVYWRGRLLGLQYAWMP